MPISYYRRHTHAAGPGEENKTEEMKVADYDNLVSSQARKFLQAKEKFCLS